MNKILKQISGCILLILGASIIGLGYWIMFCAHNNLLSFILGPGTFMLGAITIITGMNLTNK